MANSPCSKDKERYIACFILQGVGDAMGYRCGSWEFCHSSRQIHADLSRLTNGIGVSALSLVLPDWNLSDDTIMAIASAEGFIKAHDKEFSVQCQSIAQQYFECWKDMAGRAPGGTCAYGVSRCGKDGLGWQSIPFDRAGGGCGAAMRAMPFGLVYPNDLNKLIPIAIESGRMSHHHPTGYLGAVASAVFCSYALQNKPVRQWGHDLLHTVIPMCKQYIENAARDVKDNLEAFDYFESTWQAYLELREISDGKSIPVFPENFDGKARDKFYRSVSYNGWGGASGHDAPLIAYDALLGAIYDVGCQVKASTIDDTKSTTDPVANKSTTDPVANKSTTDPVANKSTTDPVAKSTTDPVAKSTTDPVANWDELCLRGVLHGGDSDSTGILCCGWYGAMYGFTNVPLCNYEQLEYRERIQNIGERLFDIACESK